MPALANLVIAVSGTHKGYTQVKIEALVKDNGGTFSKNVDTATTHLVSTEADVQKGSGKVKTANDAGKSVVSLDWLLKSVEEGKKEDEADYLLTATPVAAPVSNRRPKRKATTDTAAAMKIDEEDDEGDAAPPAKKSKPTPAPASKSKAKGKAKAKPEPEPEDEEMKDADEEEEKAATPPPPKMKTIIKKGKAPVDELCPLSGTHHVYVDGAGVAWDATLNQTDIGRNNNKFYYCQLLEKDSSPVTYAVFCRWGRVGDRGQSKMYAQNTTFHDAQNTFEKQMKAKTGKNWAQRDQALGGGKKYAYLERNYDEDDEDKDEDDAKDNEPSTSKEQVEVKPPPKSKIAKPLVSLMELIFNTSFMQQTMQSMSYDSNKLPLGKLSKDTILRGFNLLKQIGEAIADPSTAVQNFGQYGASYNEILNQLSSRYYTVIPHNFGRNVPPVIDSQAALKREADLVENLIEMKISTEIMSATAKMHDDVHPADRQYASLGLNEATPLDKSSSEFKYLEAYVKKTHGHTHQYLRLQVEEIFRIGKTQEEERWNNNGWGQYRNDNRKLLWHGSRTTNFSGILSQGLRIAPPEAPVSGYMFDKGIYLADIVSKSANYCYPSLSANTALLLLCETQLGDPMYESKNADYYAATSSKKAGAIATKGLGRTVPSEWEDASIIHDSLTGVKIPKLSGPETVATKDQNDAGLYLQYNEYIVYDVSQVKLRYLFRITTN